MEIITIDSSDDENPIPTDIAFKNKPRLITPRVQTDSDCDSSSVSSNDSIWDKGICSRDAVKIAKDAEEVVVSECDGKEGSVSSNDSFWEKVGIFSIETDTLAKPLSCAGEEGEFGASGNKEVIQMRKDDDIVSTKNDLECDDSSVSSDDSIWNTVVPSSRQDKLIAIDQTSEKNRSETKSSNHKNETSNKRVPSKIDTTKDQIECHDLNNNLNDDSSASSEDSILDKKFFERKKHPGTAPIKSYYDYCRYYANKPTTNHDSESLDANKVESTNKQTASLPPEVPLPTNATWKIILLMDHREFGTSNNFLQHVESRINSHFGAVHSEITTLPSADYLYVARLISDEGKVLDERVLDMVIERKAVQDVCSCLVTDSKKYRPLSFFEAQMFKLQNCGMGKKLFVMEGDEDRTKGLFHGAKSQAERERRLKRVKTLRLQLANGEFEGVDLICTKGRNDTVKFLIHQLECFQQSFDPSRPPIKTRELLKNYINRQMKAPTFLEYLRLRSIPSIGDVKAMKVIMDPNLDWDKTFISPSSSKLSKSTLEDKATFWRPPSTTNESKAKGKSAAAAKTNYTTTETLTDATAKAKSTGRKVQNDKSNTTNASKATPNHTESNKITSFFNQNGSSKATKSAREINGEAGIVLVHSDEEKENTASS